MRVCILLLGFLAIATPARAEQFIIDLASSVTTASFSRPPGTMMQFVVRHKLPKADYKIIVETRSLEIPPFQNPQTLPKRATDSPCEALDASIQAIYAAKDEKELVAPIAQIRAGVDADVCAGDANRAAELRRGLAATEVQVAGSYEVRRGEQIIVTISRGDTAWVYSISGGARGSWLTSYGPGVVPDLGRRMSLKGDAASGFVITPESEPDGPRVLPAVFFTWLSAARQDVDWSHGPTAGLGVGDKAPAVFAGWSVTYNQNLTFIGGMALAQHQRLRGQYAEGETLKQTLQEDQLHQGVYKPSWMIAVTFRFGENPFGEGAAKKPTEKANGGQ